MKIVLSGGSSRIFNRALAGWEFGIHSFSASVIITMFQLDEELVKYNFFFRYRIEFNKIVFAFSSSIAW